MRRALPALLALSLLAPVLAACGRVGPPRPPGPPEQIIFPRSYPAPDRPDPGASGRAVPLPPR